MNGLKIAVIGAGSTYTPELIDGFLRRTESLKLDSVFFMDIHLEKANIVVSLCRRMMEARGISPRIVVTDSLEEAVEGASYVLGQVRVGMLEARVRDERIPLKYNLLGQETTGAGGFMKALRTIPVIMNVARTMERLAPDAWLINFSNPSGIIAEAVLNNSSVRMMGLCNGPINMIRDARKRVAEGAQFDYDFVGLNHLCWINGIHENGREVLQEQIRNLRTGTDQSGFRTTSRMANLPDMPFSAEVMSVMGGLPIGYLNYFLNRDETVKHCLEAQQTRGEICMDIEAELLALYQDPTLKEKPAVLDKRGGALYSEAAVSLIDAMENDRREIHVVDVKNLGTVPFLHPDDVVETKCVVGRNGPVPLPLPHAPSGYIIGMMQAVKAYEKLTVKAGLTGDADAALAALLAHPLIGDAGRTLPLLTEMLNANREHLPQFDSWFTEQEARSRG